MLRSHECVAINLHSLHSCTLLLHPGYGTGNLIGHTENSLIACVMSVQPTLNITLSVPQCITNQLRTCEAKKPAQ